MINLTELQRSNLDKLATYLESLSEDYNHFDMATYMYGFGHSIDTLIHYVKHNGGVDSCGTTACAVGHGPAAGIFFSDEELEPDGIASEINWNLYAANNFVGGDTHTQTPEYHWCFGGSWVWHDNHHYGAAARIRYMLAHGVPKDFNHSMSYNNFMHFYSPYDKRYNSTIQTVETSDED